MATEKITAMPMVSAALLTDIIYDIQAGVSSQATMQQVFDLMLTNTILNHAGNPNGFVAGEVYQFCWDTIDAVLYLCTTSGDAASAVWTVISSTTPGVVSPAHGGTGVSSPTAHTLPVAQGISDFNFLGPLTNGQLLIGSTGIDPVPTTLTAGTNISIVNAAGAITISGTGTGGFSWHDVIGATQTLAGNNGYVTNRGAGNVAYTLPLTSAVGDEIIIVGNLNGWTIAQLTGQTITIGTTTTTMGVGGSLASTNAGDSLIMICTVANTKWTVISLIGNLTIV